MRPGQQARQSPRLFREWGWAGSPDQGEWGGAKLQDSGIWRGGSRAKLQDPSSLGEWVGLSHRPVGWLSCRLRALRVSGGAEPQDLGTQAAGWGQAALEALGSLPTPQHPEKGLAGP